MANIIVEIPYMILTGILIFICYVYAVVGIDGPASQVTVLLLCIQFFVYAGTFAHMIIAALPDAVTANAVVVLLYAMSLTFCGVLQSPSALPGFWIFMYRVSPFTYWVSAMVSTLVHDREITCSSAELAIFDPPSGQTCGQYLGEYINLAGGQLLDWNVTSDCRYCAVQKADQYIAGSQINFSDRWRNFGIVWAYIALNTLVATLTYYLFRVRRWDLKSIKKSLLPPWFVNTKA
jgi:ABC-type multidrug transport system permease subunit